MGFEQGSGRARFAFLTQGLAGRVWDWERLHMNAARISNRISGGIGMERGQKPKNI